MSSSHYVYFGVYLKCVKAKTTEVVTGIRCSLDKDHNIRQSYDVKFCSVCGAPVAQKFAPDLLSWYHLENSDEFDLTAKEKRIVVKYENFGFDGIPDNIDYLIPQHKGVFGVYINEDEGEFETPFPEKMISQQASKQLIKEIDWMKSILYSTVEIKFGYLSQVS